MSTIQFSVHRNPQPDAEGNDTYHVRQETFGTVNKQQLMAHITHHGLLRPELLEMAMTVLEREIVEQLVFGHRMHWNGLGTFFLRLGPKILAPPSSIVTDNRHSPRPPRYFNFAA